MTAVKVPPVIVQSDVDQGKKSKKTICIVAGVTVVSVTLILAFVLVGHMFMTMKVHGMKKTNSFTTEGGHRYKEETEVYDDNVLVETLVPEGQPPVHWVLDFNRRLVAGLVHSDSTTQICYLFSLINTTEHNAKDVQTKVLQSNKMKERNIYIHVDSTPIPKLGFLSKQAQALCEDYNTYWVHPLDDCAVTKSGRERRMTTAEYCLTVGKNTVFCLLSTSK